MRSDRVMKWEKTLKRVFDEIDRELEQEYGGRWPLHPSRPKRGSTSNPEADGLFNIGAAYSAGFGSPHGPGYTVEIRLSTLDQVPSEVRAEIRRTVLERLRTRIPDTFPGNPMQVSDSDDVIRIHGDLSLD